MKKSLLLILILFVSFNFAFSKNKTEFEKAISSQTIPSNLFQRESQDEKFKIQPSELIVNVNSKFVYVCVFAFRTGSASYTGCDGLEYSSTFTGSGFYCHDDPLAASLGAVIMAQQDMMRIGSAISFEEEGPPC